MYTKMISHRASTWTCELTSLIRTRMQWSVERHWRRGETVWIGEMDKEKEQDGILLGGALSKEDWVEPPSGESV